jgi:hypothetical protein
MKKRLLCICLAAILAISSLLTGCADSGKAEDNPAASAQTPAGTADPAAAQETEEPADNRASVKDDLPDDLDFGGRSILILARNKSWFDGEMFTEELNGETLNDAVFKRDISVEDRLHVKVDYQLEGETNDFVNNNVKAGSDEFGFHVGSAVDTVQYGVKGYYYNLLGDYPEYLNLDQPWWSRYYTQQSSIGGKAFFATGDLFTSLIKLSFVTYVNLKMIEDYQFENPYDLVRYGGWTFDKEMEMALQVYRDNNGNGISDERDTFGMSMAGSIGLDVYWSAFDLTICEKDAEDMPSFSVDEEKMSAVLAKLYQYYENCDSVFTPPDTSDSEQDVVAQMLAEDRMLFSPLRIMHTDQIREMESNYGLIPLPKWDEEQQNYYTFVHDQYSIGGIPVSVQDPSMVSAVAEAMAAESYRTVTPAYYDVVLNGKYLRDLDSSEMLEIAMEGIKIDFGWIHTYSLSSCSQELLRRILYSNHSGDFSSHYARNRKMFEKVMTKLRDAVEKIDN